jgi:hypothetical protein
MFVKGRVVADWLIFKSRNGLGEEISVPASIPNKGFVVGGETQAGVLRGTIGFCLEPMSACSGDLGSDSPCQHGVPGCDFLHPFSTQDFCE